MNPDHFDPATFGRVLGDEMRKARKRCELFRREGGGQASALILEAEALVRGVWPEVRRFFTYVDPARVASPNPGYCFLCAGYRRDGVSASGKLRLVKEVLCSEAS